MRVLFAALILSKCNYLFLLWAAGILCGFDSCSQDDDVRPPANNTTTALTPITTRDAEQRFYNTVPLGI